MTRYISWNVNGLRAVQKKGFAESVLSLDADCICLQETKLQEGQTDLTLPGRSRISLPSRRCLTR